MRSPKFFMELSETLPFLRQSCHAPVQKFLVAAEEQLLREVHDN